MARTRIPVDALTPTHFAKTPVWEFVSDPRRGEDETYVAPVKSSRVDELSNRVVGCQVTLANGTQRWALLSNVALRDPELTRHFLAVAVWLGDAWFHLARYHDVDRRSHGPRALARALDLPLKAVFPMAYDLARVAIGDPGVLHGTIPAVPAKRVSRATRLRWAVAGASG